MCMEHKNKYDTFLLSYTKFTECFLLCLFGVFHPTREFFTRSFRDVTFVGEELQILTYARHLWPLSSEGSFACHTYCGTGHPFKMVSGAVTTCFNDIGLGFEHPAFRLWGERTNPLRHCRIFFVVFI